MPRKSDGKITDNARVIELCFKSMKMAPERVAIMIVRIIATPPRYGTALVCVL
jgi:hypothetical protein